MDLQVAKSEFAFVLLDEFWGLDSSKNPAGRHFRTSDVWVKRGGEWKLLKRNWMVSSRTDLVFP
jgi:hypothetical protein